GRLPGLQSGREPRLRLGRARWGKRSCDAEGDSRGARDRRAAAVREHRTLRRPVRLDHCRRDGRRVARRGARVAAGELLAEGSRAPAPRRGGRVTVELSRGGEADEQAVRNLFTAYFYEMAAWDPGILMNEF